MDKSELAQFQEGEQFEMWFVPIPGHEPLCLPAQFRHATVSPESNRVILGFQIVGLEMTEEGRGLLRQIARIAGVYQRRRQLSDHPDLIKR